MVYLSRLKNEFVRMIHWFFHNVDWQETASPIARNDPGRAIAAKQQTNLHGCWVWHGQHIAITSPKHGEDIAKTYKSDENAPMTGYKTGPYSSGLVMQDHPINMKLWAIDRPTGSSSLRLHQVSSSVKSRSSSGQGISGEVEPPNLRIESTSANSGPIIKDRAMGRLPNGSKYGLILFDFVDIHRQEDSGAPCASKVSRYLKTEVASE